MSLIPIEINLTDISTLDSIEIPKNIYFDSTNTSSTIKTNFVDNLVKT